jgi:hypothetical protein
MLRETLWFLPILLVVSWCWGLNFGAGLLVLLLFDSLFLLVLFGNPRFRVPDGCDLVAAGALLVAYGTSHVGLVHRAQLQANQVEFEFFLSIWYG